jgi:site-specific recombinase XerD
MSDNDRRIPSAVVARPRPPLHPAIDEHLAALELRGRHLTAAGRRTALRDLLAWLTDRRVDLLAVTTEDLLAYQAHLAGGFSSVPGRPLGREGQASRVFRIKSFYRWAEFRGLVLVDPARPLRVHVVRSRVVLRDHLTLQEATALLQTAAAVVRERDEGTRRWAIAVRDLALLCLALATGRRRSGLIGLTLDDVDLANAELRCEREKGRAGRVNPVAGWAVDVLRLYMERARLVLIGDAAVPWLFVGRSGDRPMTAALLWYAFRPLLARTIRDNPDLAELAGKRVTWHSLRVSFAVALFINGCDIRSVSELLLHRTLSTTARYTPLGFDDLRLACRRAHPRA